MTPAEAFTALVLEVFRLNGSLLAAGDRLAAPVGLTSARWQVLGAIDEAPLPVAGIARRMGLRRQSVQRTVEILAAEGVVALIDNPRHKRARLVTPSARGRAMLEEITAVQREWAARAADGIAADDIAATARLLAILRERLMSDDGDDE